MQSNKISRVLMRCIENINQSLFREIPHMYSAHSVHTLNVLLLCIGDTMVSIATGNTALAIH